VMIVSVRRSCRMAGSEGSKASMGRSEVCVMGDQTSQPQQSCRDAGINTLSWNPRCTCATVRRKAHFPRFAPLRCHTVLRTIDALRAYPCKTVCVRLFAS
jgi:hypothetical protein